MNKKNKILMLCAIFVFFGLGSIFILSRGTYSNADSEIGTIVVDCNNIASELETSVVCNIKGVNFTGEVSSFRADLLFDDNLSLFDFSFDNNEWQGSLENGDIDLYTDVNKTGNFDIATFTFKAISENTSNILLQNIYIGNENFDEYALNDISIDVVLENTKINALSSLTVMGVEFDFASNIMHYDLSLDLDSTTVEAVALDDTATVSGDVGEVQLDYGINNFSIVVTGEDGSETIYTMSIYREYVFACEYYSYDLEQGYIYTGTDTDSEVILNNLKLSSELNGNIDNGNLVISYGKEILIELKLVNISSSIYDLSNDYIYLGNDNIDLNGIDVLNCTIQIVGSKLMVFYSNNIIDEYEVLTIDFGVMSENNNIINLDEVLTYDEFINNLSISSNIDYKVLNGNVEINSGNLSNDMKFMLYYEGILLDEFDISIYSLLFDEVLNEDSGLNYIKYLEYGTTVTDLLKNVTVIGGTVSIYDKDNNKKDNSDLLATGDRLISYIDTTKKEEYTLSVLGDSNGDGEIDLLDLVQIRKHIVGWFNPNTGSIEKKTGVYYYAIDMNSDGEIDLIDLIKIRKAIVGVN